MTAKNQAGPTAYGPLVAADGSLLTDTEDGVAAFVPQIAPSTGQLSAGSVNPAQNWLTTGGIPVLNAILVELRVISALLNEGRGASALDLEQLRASELFDSSTSTGVV